MVRKLSAANKVTLGAMICALTLLCLYAGNTLPTGRLACIFLSSVFVYALACEGAYASALLSFAACSCLAFFVLPNKLLLVPYCFLLGHYGIFKSFIEKKLHDRSMQLIIKLLYCNALTAAGVAVATLILNYDIMTMLPKLPVWLIVMIAEVAFVAYDVVFSLVCRIYEARIRNSILPRR